MKKALGIKVLIALWALTQFHLHATETTKETPTEIETKAAAEPVTETATTTETARKTDPETGTNPGDFPVSEKDEIETGFENGASPRSENLFSVIQQGGWVMFFLLGMLLLGMTLVGERCIYYVAHKSWEKAPLEKHLYNTFQMSGAKYKEEMETDLRGHLQLYFNRLEKSLNLIHGIGNLAPLIGFFGTVIGMIRAFAAIASAAVVNAKVVAVGIQMALVTTAGGLAVAVLTLSFYHLFSHIVQSQYAFSDEVIQTLVGKLPPYSEK